NPCRCAVLWRDDSTMNHARLIHLLILCSSFILHPTSFLRADGGTIRLSERTGGYQVTVFTSPSPLRAGPVDVSVFIQSSSTGELITEARVTVQVAPHGRPEEAVSHPATTVTATNKL